MEYCITMERVQRIAVRFNCDSDEEAQKKANEIFDNTKAEDYEGGDVEEDYALDDETGRNIVAWR